MTTDNGSSPPLAPLKTGTIIRAGLRGRCPRCGKGRLFRSYLKITRRCDACGLGFAGHDVGDAPVVPAILLLGGVIAGLARRFKKELSYQPLPRGVTAGFAGGEGLSYYNEKRFRDC